MSMEGQYKMKKPAYIILLIVVALFAMTGCKKKKAHIDDIIKEYEVTIKPSPTPTITPEPTSEPEIIEETHEGEMRSSLSGLWVPIEIGNKRPYAIQFSNFKTVRNQWGIGQADIVYEAFVEGGITRFLAIGENFTGDRIGSVRSSRHYFVSFADEYDAIYIHYGKTKYADHYYLYPRSWIEKEGDIYKCPNCEGFEEKDQAIEYAKHNNIEYNEDEWEYIVCESRILNGYFYTDRNGNLHEGYPC